MNKVRECVIASSVRLSCTWPAAGVNHYRISCIQENNMTAAAASQQDSRVWACIPGMRVRHHASPPSRTHYRIEGDVTGPFTFSRVFLIVQIRRNREISSPSVPFGAEHTHLRAPYGGSAHMPLEQVDGSLAIHPSHVLMERLL